MDNKSLIINHCGIKIPPLCNYSVVQLRQWKNHVPVLSPYDIAILNGKLLEISRFYVLVVLRMWICENKWFKIHTSGCSVAEE